VVIPLAIQHCWLIEWNLLYTAAMRGKQLVVVIAEPKALQMAVRNRRITRLTERLGGECGGDCGLMWIAWVAHYLVFITIAI
jgi:hypothetical protein